MYFVLTQIFVKSDDLMAQLQESRQFWLGNVYCLPNNYNSVNSTADKNLTRSCANPYVDPSTKLIIYAS
ncbi:hypothetical protein TTHERM_000372548 (macronuclear) [Tetrahymena thermophila SB210]|uniref:Uncharacterized protein n=1 Tax=Tetrahymena thermophila (strain SB210) TaxID=312017 RepID=W7X9D3_TETTS|nr:hypothetical protein TTHERM_000372548 [Tetrahymena thermophila SB210]EWS76010.1 hypothetical protein TTHERM_000372548 [Tetrahymena thermophila SB210]|eukprot:XP_012651448.1 hypothetical protein TTHERM_000372548 [Tetrahymena thermophila SB210]